MSISTLGEHALIARIKTRAGDAPPWVQIGIGDDAAVIEPARGELDIVTTDCQVEDVHFSRAWMSMREIGAKALAVNISDMAAMAAMPRAATLSLALPAALAIDEFDALIDGFLRLARAAKITLVGGNLSRSPGPLFIDVTLIGSARKRRILTRGGGAPGHLLYVTGYLGGAAHRVANALRSDDLTGRWGERTVALVACSRAVSANRLASACMDLSDGLADGVRQLAAASGTGAAVLSSKVPVAPGATLEQALTGGEDYELLFAVPARRRRGFEKIAGQQSTVTCIGELTKAPDLSIDGAPLPAGFSHF